MRQSVSLITLGVADYDRAKGFYEALGWSAALEIQETAFFQANGVVVVLWSREKLAEDMVIEDDGARWSGITLAHNVGSREEVDALVERAVANGATVTRERASSQMANVGITESSANGSSNASTISSSVSSSRGCTSNSVWSVP